MKITKSIAIVSALVALGIAGPASALASDAADQTPAAADVQSTHDEQQSGEQGDVENTDLAVQIEEKDGANNQSGVNEEGQVGDGADGQVDDGPAGDH